MIQEIWVGSENLPFLQVPKGCWCWSVGQTALFHPQVLHHPQVQIQPKPPLHRIRVLPFCPSTEPHVTVTALMSAWSSILLNPVIVSSNSSAQPPSLHSKAAITSPVTAWYSRHLPHHTPWSFPTEQPNSFLHALAMLLSPLGCLPHHHFLQQPASHSPGLSWVLIPPWSSSGSKPHPNPPLPRINVHLFCPSTRPQVTVTA